MSISPRLKHLLVVLLVVGVAFAAAASARAEPPPAAAPSDNDRLAAEIAALKAQLAALQKRVQQPELGQQMLELQSRHDRLWWAGQAGNWTLAYFMVGELGEAMRGIEQTNGEAPELQPEKLSELMPAIMNQPSRACRTHWRNRTRPRSARRMTGCRHRAMRVITWRVPTSS